jgi:predicted nucleic acid-binding protein
MSPLCGQLTRPQCGQAGKFGQRYRFAWYDSLIIAAALAAGCYILYTEDMQHGQVINGKLTLLNPFVPENRL